MPLAAHSVVDQNRHLPRPLDRFTQRAVEHHPPGPLQAALFEDYPAGRAGKATAHLASLLVYRHFPENHLSAALRAGKNIGPYGIVDLP